MKPSKKLQPKKIPPKVIPPVRTGHGGIIRK